VWELRSTYHSIYTHLKARALQRQRWKERLPTLQFLDETLKDSNDVHKLMQNRLGPSISLASNLFLCQMIVRFVGTYRYQHRYSPP
jgi:hypothetical protein